MDMIGFRIKPEMKLGVAVSATQIEGGDRNNSWYDWYRKGKIKDNSSPERANRHYELFREDTDLLKETLIQTYRFGIEWSRIEPKPGEFRQDVLNRYREEISLLTEAGILPLLTLHHFTNPLWFEEMGGFENPDSVPIFLRFTEKVVSSFGDLVSEYITVNEPNVYSVGGFFFGNWPPGKKSFRSVLKVYRHLTECHVKAYEFIHNIRKNKGYHDTKVGFAHHMRVFEPKNPNNPLHRLYANCSEYLFQDVICKAFMTGVCEFPLKKPKDIKPGKYYDFIGLNYYSRSTVSRFGDGVKGNVPVNDLGWEIYPQGILECAKKLYNQYSAPVYITENGTCDNEDKFRSRFIYEHLKVLCESNLPVHRYYHWCFLDNFEWLEGESARFGIVHVDFETQKRTVKKSGYFYREIIRNGGVSEEMARECLNEEYKINDPKEKIIGGAWS
jgi:beta-glucosidase